ncbi:MAG: hypothetical protein ACOCNM_00260 [Prevotella pectinovora]
MKVTHIEDAEWNATAAVDSFVRQWIPMPKFDLGVEVMDQGQLRDIMGLRATIDIGDPWPQAERLLMEHGFRWHYLEGHRVMFLKENDSYKPDDGWQEAEEYNDDEDEHYID